MNQPDDQMPNPSVTQLLDAVESHSFSPGKIDGHWGDFCAKALQRYQLAHGQQTTSQLDPAGASPDFTTVY